MAGKSAGAVTITMRAGTMEFQRDVDKATAKIRDFQKAAVTAGQHTQGSMVMAGASIRLLEGNVTHSLRAVERFLSTTAGLGPMFNAIFPVVGAIAFTGVIVEMGKKVFEFYKAIQQAPERIGGLFRELNAPLRSVNDQLQVTNDRLANDIAKLEGKRQNTLKLALDEARVAADRLADSLDKDLNTLHKLLKEQESGFWKSLVSGSASTKDIAKEIGGESGFGGFRGRVAQITDDGNDRIREATNLKAKDAAQTALNTRLQAAYAVELAKVDSLIAQANEQSRSTLRREISDKSKTLANPQGVSSIVGHVAQDERQRLEMLAGVRRNLLAEQAGIGLQATNTDLTGKKESLEAGAANAKLDRPFQDRIKAMQAEFRGIEEKLSSVGLSSGFQILTEAASKALKIIAEVNKAMERQHTSLTDSEKDKIELLSLDIATAEAQLKWREKVEATTSKIKEQVQIQQMLTAAIGKGFEAVKKVNVESQVMREAGLKDYFDPSKAGDIAKLRAGFAGAADAANAEKAAAATDKLSTQIELERSLAAVQSQGAEAIRVVTLAYKLKEITSQHGLEVARELIKAEIELYNSQRTTVAAAEIAKLNERIETVKKLSGAVLEGAEAERKAMLENKYAEMEHAGTAPEAIQRTRETDKSERELAITARVAERLNVYKNHLDDLNQEMTQLRGITVTESNRLDIARSYRDLQNESLRALVDESLAMRGARDGVRAFFLEMQQDSRNTAVVMYETLNKAVEGISSSVARLATRQRAGFGQMFQNLGEGLIQSTVKGQLQRGLGALGKVFGIDTGKLGKPDGSKANPLWVQLAGTKAKGLSLPGNTGESDGFDDSELSPAGGIGGLFKKLKGLFGGGDMGGGIFSMLASSLIPHAAGGPVSASSAYLVGEHGPEILTGASGRILDNATSQRALGGGGPMHYYSIDARGTDPVQTEERVRTAIIAAHNSAVGTSIRANHDQVRRMPAGARA